MTPKEHRASLAWLKKQRTNIVFDVPDRKPDEQPATAKQKDYIRGLTASIDEAALSTLGKWQAASLIEQIKTERELMTQEKAIEYTKIMRRRGSYRKLAVWVLLMAAGGAAIFYFSKVR